MGFIGENTPVLSKVLIIVCHWLVGFTSSATDSSGLSMRNFGV
jgi:hypothetical protein